MRSSSTLPLVAAAVLLAGAGLVLTAFFIQNSLRMVTLSLNLGFAAWQYPPVSIMTFAGGAFLLGFLVALGLSLWRNWGLRSRVRQLERQLAMAEAGGF
jgi:uncharacterized integral membrane protein